MVTMGGGRLSQEDEANVYSSGRNIVYGQNNQPIITSRRGAPLSRADNMSGLTGISGNPGTAGHDAGWQSFFNQQAPPIGGVPSAGTGNAGVDEDTAFGGGTPTAYGTTAVGLGVPSSGDHVGASIAANSQWLGQNGIAFPPPPTPRANLLPTGTNPQSFPNMANDPALNKGGNISASGVVNPAYAANVSAFNNRLYQPADTQPAPQQNNWPTLKPGAVQPGNYVTPYGNASVQNFRGATAGGFYPPQSNS